MCQTNQLTNLLYNLITCQILVDSLHMKKNILELILKG